MLVCVLFLSNASTTGSITDYGDSCRLSVKLQTNLEDLDFRCRLYSFLLD